MKDNRITHKDIAEYIGKSTDTINGWTLRQPKLLELVKLGMTCKDYDLDANKIKKLANLKNTIQNS